MPKAFRTVALLAILTTAQPSLASAQAYPIRTEVPGWIIERTIFNECNAISRYDSGTVITLKTNLADELSVTIARPDLAQLVGSRQFHKVRYAFSDRSLSGVARLIREPSVGLEVLFGPADSAAFLDSWSKSPSLIVDDEAAGRIAGLSSGGAPAAHTALLACKKEALLDAFKNVGVTGADARKRSLAEDGASRRTSDAQKYTQQAQKEADEEERLDLECEAGFDRAETELEGLDRAEAELARDTSMWAASRDALYASRKSSARLSPYEDRLQVDYLEAERLRLNQREADLRARVRAHNARLDDLEEDCL